MSFKYHYRYAVIDPSVPGEPHFWPLAGYSLGDAAAIGWTAEFIPEADANTDLLIANLNRHRGRITIATFENRGRSAETPWRKGISYDQLRITVAQGEDDRRKLGFYHVRVLKVSKKSDSNHHRVIRYPASIILCHVTRGGFVSTPVD